MKARLGAIEVALLEQFKSAGDVTTVTALGAAEAFAIVIVGVIDHQADANTLERVEHLPQGAAQHVKERVWANGRHVAFRDQRVALVAVAGRRPEVGSIIQREHDHRFAVCRQTGARVHVNVRVIGLCGPYRNDQRREQ